MLERMAIKISIDVIALRKIKVADVIACNLLIMINFTLCTFHKHLEIETLVEINILILYMKFYSN